MEELGAGALAEFTICMQIQVVQESIGVVEGDKHKQRGNQAFVWYGVTSKFVMPVVGMQSAGDISART